MKLHAPRSAVLGGALAALTVAGGLGYLLTRETEEELSPPPADASRASRRVRQRAALSANVRRAYSSGYATRATPASWRTP